ncbi:MAG: hypothetical protein NZ740_05070 [Kiritimatiellae bacterium]|nr:hypothetical protein [Kiritimatiellia bacterium]MDW8458464.1 hypothetical protein [Verrucomicrobiota bacterium]
MKRRKIVIAVFLLAVVGIAGLVIGFRGHRLTKLAFDFRDQIRYLLETGETIGEIPASEAFGAAFLDAIFGSEPELLARLRNVISKGLQENPNINLGEVAAILVTYRKNSENQISDVAAHIIGGFPLARRKPGFNRDGYFRAQLDQQLWTTGNSMLSILGRDIIVFADEEVANAQYTILDSIRSGEIIPLVEFITERPLYYAAVFPDPRRIVPTQLRSHIQSIIVRGQLAPLQGSSEIILLSASSDSAAYTASLLFDLRLAAILALQTRFGGTAVQSELGTRIPVWWADEMARNLQRSTIEKSLNLVLMRMNFERVMVNATLKSIERLGRDMARMRGTIDEKMDPRLVDQRMKSEKPLNYWSDAHRWGPDWPIPDPNRVKSMPEESPDEQIAPPVSPSA